METKAIIRCVILASTAAAMPVVEAQTTAAEQTARDVDSEPRAAGALEDIVVTAQRRSEPLQDVPIAVTALSADAIAKAGASGTLDLASLSPGLQMNLSRSTVVPYLRGVGTQNGGVGEEGSIATYIDGVYITTLSAANVAFNSIERIEVLKGPQGTLFGRNATGGLIHVITRDPSHATMLDVDVGYSNFDTSTTSVYGTAGLSDSVAVDLAGFFTNQGEGWGRNLVRGNDVNLRDEWALRGKLLFEPTEALTIRLSGDYNDRQSDLGLTRIIYPGALGIGGMAFRGGLYDSQSNLDRDVDFHQWGTSLQIDYDLGAATLTSTTAYRDVFNFGLFDQDATPLPVIDAPITETTNSVQQEFLLVGTTGTLEYTTGAFYFSSDARYDPLSLRSAIIPPQNLDRFVQMLTYSYAGFAQGTYALDERTHLTAGLRYTRDEREIEGRDVSVSGHPSGAGVLLRSTADNPFPDKAAYEKLTWRFALDRRLSEDVLAYASLSRGFKSGVYNVTNPYQPPVRPETLDAYEVGIKSDLAGQRLRLNTSGFYYDYKDIQLVHVESGATLLVNAASARVYGIDLEAIAIPPVPTGDLQLRVAMSYLNGEYQDFPGAPITSRNPAGGNFQVSGDASGNKTIKTPPFSLTLTGDYSIPIGDNTFNVNVSYYLNTGFYWDPDNRLHEPSYNLLNAQLNFFGPDRRWRASGFVRNLMDERYFTQTGSSTLGDQATTGAPRTYGVSIGYRFGG
jgi:iron complex outermembrane receptor protein